jgi:hypothetical protein
MLVGEAQMESIVMRDRHREADFPGRIWVTVSCSNCSEQVNGSTEYYSGPQNSDQAKGEKFGRVVDAGEAMTTARKQYSPKLKARVAIEAIRGEDAEPVGVAV